MASEQSNGVVKIAICNPANWNLTKDVRSYHSLAAVAQSVTTK